MQSGVATPLRSRSCVRGIFNYIGDEYHYQSAKPATQVYKASKQSKNVSEYSIYSNVQTRVPVAIAEQRLFTQTAESK